MSWFSKEFFQGGHQFVCFAVSDFIQVIYFCSVNFQPSDGDWFFGAEDEYVSCFFFFFNEFEGFIVAYVAGGKCRGVFGVYQVADCNKGGEPVEFFLVGLCLC